MLYHLLIKVYRNIIFIHDTFIYASHLFGRIYREIPLIVMPKIKKKEEKKPPEIQVLEWLTGYQISSSGRKFYDEIDVIDRVEEELNEKLEVIQPKNILEYVLRGLPRSILQKLISLGYIWIIPYNNIVSLSIEKYRDEKIIRIEYNCPITNTRRVFKTIYDPEIYDLIKKLLDKSRELVEDKGL